MVNFGSLAAEIGSLVWGTPANFNLFILCTVSEIWRDVGRKSPILTYRIWRPCWDQSTSISPGSLAQKTRFPVRRCLRDGMSVLTELRHVMNRGQAEEDSAVAYRALALCRAVKAKFHYASFFGAGSELVRS